MRNIMASTTTRLALATVAVLALAGCGGTTASAGPTSGSATAAPPATSGGSTACIDSDTAAIIQELREPGADVAAILTADGDDLLAGLASFTPPANATAWRDALVAAVQAGDAAAVQTEVQKIGSEVVLEFC